MSAPTAEHPKRIRASKKALETALDVLQERGVSVEKLLVVGGQFEIHVGHVEGGKERENHGGLKQW